MDNMNDIGTNLTIGGVVMTTREIEETRRRQGKCISCGQRCFHKKLFKMIPITDHGNVLKGRCLICKPLPIIPGHAPPAASRPATLQDQARFRQSQRSLFSGGNLGRPSYVPMRPIPSTKPLSESQLVPKIDTKLKIRPRPTRFSLDSSMDVAVVGNSISIGNEGVQGSSRSIDSTSNLSAGSSAESREGGPVTLKNNLQNNVEADVASLPSARKIPVPESQGDRENDVFKDDMRNSSHSNLSSQDEDRKEPAHKVLNRGGAVVFTGRGASGSSQRTMSSSSITSDRVDEDMAGRRTSFRYQPRQNSSRKMSSRNLIPAQDRNISTRNIVVEEAEDRAHLIIARAGSDFAIVLQHMKEHPASSTIQQEALTALSTLNLNVAEHAEIATLRGFDTIVMGMRSHPHDIDVQISGCSAIWNLSRDTINQSAMVQAGALDTIHTSMVGFRGDAELQEKALAAISNLSAAEENIPIMIDKGTISKIVEAMNSHAEDGPVQIKGCSAIANLSSHDKGELYKENFMPSGAGEALIISMIMHPDEAELQETALEAICNICSNSNAIDLGNVGANDAAITAMQVHRDEPGIQAAGACVLSNLDVNAQSKANIGDGGGIDVLVRAMWVHSGNVDVNRHCASALSSLTEDIHNAKMLMEVGGIEATVNVMQAHSDESIVQAKSCRILKNMANIDDDTKCRIVEEEALDAIVMAMVIHCEVVDCQEQACKVLQNLAIASNLQQMVAANVGQLVHSAGENFPERCREDAEHLHGKLS